ncbi:MAG: tetratricopeptide repeat protein [Acidobacteria bacterium]|nr:tetratricopeptide repeat protein [Acidobacteriota bacterium]
MPLRIDSWKEIAVYLKRGTRTVQRWEREEGLPVHRLVHDKLGSVYAFDEELDAWWSARKPLQERQGVWAAPPEDDKPSIAVMPFVDWSEERDQGYFCDGMAEEIIIALSRIRSLRVASRMASFRFRNAGADTMEVGRKLRARTLLEGSVRKSGGRLRIAVQLTAAQDGFQMWAEVYDRTMGDVFAIQEEIAGTVARELKLTLTPGEREALARVPTRDLDAYDLYLQGRTSYFRYSNAGVERAIQLFAQAVEKDHEFPLAYAGLADCWSYLFLYSERSAEYLARADEASLRAVALDPQSSQAHASRALVLSLKSRDEEAERAFKEAIRLDPNLFEAHYFYARHAFNMGQQEKALSLYEQAMRIRPEDYQAPLLAAQTYDDFGRPEDARAARLHGIEEVEQHLLAHPDDSRAVYLAANGMAGLGQKERALEWAGRALAMSPNDPMLLYNIGCIYSMLGKLDDAMATLESAARHGLRQRGWFEHDSNLDPLRRRKRFKNLLEMLD